MGAFIILGITLIIGIILYKPINDLEEWGWFFGLFLLCVCAILLFLLALSHLSEEVINEYEEIQYKIQGLENNIETTSNTNGAFILGFGFINSETEKEIKYYYFKVNELGKKLESTDTDIYIRETDDIKPCLIYKYQEKQCTGFFKWLFGEMKHTDIGDKILVVPENTIKIEYNVDI